MIEGFPALIARPVRFTDYCSVEVDEAQDKCSTFSSATAGVSHRSHKRTCTSSERSAEELMKSMLRR